MKKATITLLLLTMTLTTTLAGKYKILYLNSQRITIDGKPAMVGHTFSEHALIGWTEERQAMKVIDTETNTRYLLVAKMAEGRQQTAYDILTRNKHLSTHDDGLDVKSSISKLRMSIADRYDLMDRIELPTELKADETHYFLATYDYGDTRLTKRLSLERNCIVIDKTLFWVDGEKLEPRDITLSICYVNGMPDVPEFVKGLIEISIVPDRME